MHLPFGNSSRSQVVAQHGMSPLRITARYLYDVVRRREPLGRRYVIALSAVTLAFGAQIGARLDSENAYFAFWDGRDSAAIALDILVGAAVAVAGYELLSWTRAGRLLHIYRHLFLLLVLGSLLSLLSDRLHPLLHPNRSTLAWLLVVGVTAYSLGRPGCTLVHSVATLCLVAGAITPILFFQLATISSWSSPEEALPRSTPQSDSHPAFVFVFDAWSYDVSTRSNAFIPELSNLRLLCGQSTFFSNACSPAPMTRLSMPRLLFESSDKLDIDRGATFWVRDDRRAPTIDSPSLFAVPRAQGYRTCMVGWYLPYRRLLGDQVDYCCTWAAAPRGTTLLDKMLLTVLGNVVYFNGPASVRLWELADRQLGDRYAYSLCSMIRQETHNILGNGADRTVAVFHWSIPHPPFVFCANGSFHQSSRGYIQEEYYQQLLYMDSAIGEVVDTLQQRGLFDQCLLIMTSDHKGIGEPLSPDEGEHPQVPLLVKWPGQRASRLSDRYVCTTEIGRWIRQAIQGESEESFDAAWTTPLTLHAACDSEQDRDTSNSFRPSP